MLVIFEAIKSDLLELGKEGYTINGLMDYHDKKEER